MHKEKQQHLKSNNIISKLAVIVLSIVLLTGISLVPALQIGANGQVQQQQPQQQKQVGLSQVIKQIAQQVVTANPGTSATHVQQILVQLAKQTAQTASQEQAIQEIQQISSQIAKSPFGTVSQSLAHFAQQVASGNSNVVQIVQQTVQEKASSGGGGSSSSKNITQTISNTAVQLASGGSKNVNLVIRQAAQILANRAGVSVEKVEAVIIQMALQIAQAQGKDITGQSILQIANQITQNPNGVLAQAILKLVNQDDGGKSSKTMTVIKNVVRSSGSGSGGGRDDGDGGGKRNCHDIIFIGNLICNADRIIIKPQPEPPSPSPEPEIKTCPLDAGLAEFMCKTGKSKEQLCSEQPDIPGCELLPSEEVIPPISIPPGDEIRKCTTGMDLNSRACSAGKSPEQFCADNPSDPACQPLEPPKEVEPPITTPPEEVIEQNPEIRILQPGDPDYVHPDDATEVTRSTPDQSSTQEDEEVTEITDAATSEEYVGDEEEVAEDDEEEGVAVEEEVSDDDDGDESEEDDGGGGDDGGGDDGGDSDDGGDGGDDGGGEEE